MNGLTTGSSTSRCRRRSRPGTFSRPTGRARCSGCAARTTVAVHPGRDGSEFCDAPALRGAGHHRCATRRPRRRSALHLHLTLRGSRGAGLTAGRAALRFRGDHSGRRGAPGGRAAAGGGAGDGPQDAALGRSACATSTGRRRRSEPQRTRVLSVMDREADCFAVFDEAAPSEPDVEGGWCAPTMTAVSPRAPRSCSPPCAAGAADGHVEIEIDRLSAQAQVERQAGPPGSAPGGWRGPRCAIAKWWRRRPSPAPNRWRCQTVHCARNSCAAARRARRSSGSCSPVSTSTAPKPRSRIIGYYLRRWSHRRPVPACSSPGCRVEQGGRRVFTPSDRLQRCGHHQYRLIAWRLMVMTLLGRDVPGCDAQLAVSPDHRVAFRR